MNPKNPAEMTRAEIREMHDRLTDRVAYLEARTATCKKCGTALLPDSVFCHHCGRRVLAPSVEKPPSPHEAVVVKLNGLYDEKRREELALALIPILADLSQTIDMTDVEHIDVGALVGLVQLLEARESERKPPILAVGMSDGVHNTLTRAGFAKFFERV